MIIPEIKVPILLAQLEKFLKFLADNNNIATIKDQTNIYGGHLSNEAREFHFFQEQKHSNPLDLIDIGLLQAFVVNEDVISIRASINMVEGSFPGRDFYNLIYKEIYDKWYAKHPYSFDSVGHYVGIVDGIKRRIENKFNAITLPGYYRSASDADAIVKNLTFNGEATEAKKKVLEETIEKVKKREDKLFASRTEDEVERYEQIISALKQKLPELAENDHAEFMRLQDNQYSTVPANPKEIAKPQYLPTSENKLEEWKKIYLVVLDTFANFKKEYELGNDPNPEPKIKDIQDAVVSEKGIKPGKSKLYDIMRAGKQGYLD